MAFNYTPIKQLASYTLHATESIVYAAPVSKSVEVSSFWFHNPMASVIGATVFFPVSAAQVTGSATSSLSLQRLSESFSGSYTLEIAPKVPFVLNSSGSNTYNDKISMKGSQSSSLNVIIYGREEI
jgi:hypothetical protein